MTEPHAHPHKHARCKEAREWVNLQLSQKWWGFLYLEQSVSCTPSLWLCNRFFMWYFWIWSARWKQKSLHNRRNYRT